MLRNTVELYNVTNNSWQDLIILWKTREHFLFKQLPQTYDIIVHCDQNHKTETYNWVLTT